MNFLWKAFIVAVFLMAGGIAVIAQDDLFYGGFDGRWEGTLKYVPAEAYEKDRGFAPAQPVGVAFTVKGSAIKVYFKNRDDVWQETKPGRYQIIAHKTNAVVVAEDSSTDVRDTTGVGGWVENSNFSLTHKDRDGLYVIWSHQTNNYLHPYDYLEGAKGRWFSIAFGEMARVPQP